MIQPIKAMTFEFKAEKRMGRIGITCEQDEDGREVADRFVKRIHPGIGPVSFTLIAADLERGWSGQLAWWMESFEKETDF